MPSDDSAAELPTRTSLIAGLQHGDPQAWHEMVDLYAPLVHQWCRRCGVGPEATADVMQEVFAAAARHIERFAYRQDGDAFRGWLWTVARNKVRDYHRNRRRQFEPRGGSTALQRLTEFPDEASLPVDEPTDAAALSGLIRRGLDQVRSEFQEQTWTAFWRCSVDGLPTDLVAAQLQMTPAGVRQARSRVLRRLREKFGELG